MLMWMKKLIWKWRFHRHWEKNRDVWLPYQNAKKGSVIFDENEPFDLDSIPQIEVRFEAGQKIVDYHVGVG